MMPIVINSNNGSISTGIQRAIQLSNRLPSLKRVGYSPNWTAIHTVISATISRDTQLLGAPSGKGYGWHRYIALSDNRP